MRVFYVVGVVFVFFSLVGFSSAAQILYNELTTDCTKGVFWSPQLAGAGRANVFLGEHIDVIFSPLNPNYNSYLSTFGSPSLEVRDTTVGASLFETVCGSSYGPTYANLAGVLSYSISEIEAEYNLMPSSLYIESYEMYSPLPGVYWPGYEKAAFMAYKIPSAQTYINDSNFGPIQAWSVSSNYTIPPNTQQYRDISVEVDPIIQTRAITWVSAFGPLPSNAPIGFANGTNPINNGSLWRYTFSVLVPPQGTYDVYHIQAMDSSFVGVTDAITITA